MIQDGFDDLENISLGEIDHFKIVVTTSQGSKLVTLSNDAIMHVMFIRVPIILTKFLDQFLDWANGRHWPKGHLGQIWANLVKK